MAITSQLKIAKNKQTPLFPVNKETGAVGSGGGAWLLSVPTSSIHWVRVGQGPAVLAVGEGGVNSVCCISSFAPSCIYKEEYYVGQI